MDCGKIISGLVAGACGTMPIGGTATRAVILNYQDIDRDNSTVTDGVIEGITMKSGKVGYLFETVQNANEGGASFERGTYFDTYTHTVTLRIFVKSNETKAWMESLKGSRVVVLLENREQGEGHWEVYGWDSGLTLSENTYSTTYADNVVFNPTFASDDTSHEGALPKTFYKTSDANTETMVLALIATE